MMKRLKELFGFWTSDVAFILSDDLISFYTYFSLVFAEIACLWTLFPNIALPFTILGILSLLNILVCAFFKGFYEGCKRELIVARSYVAIFVAIFVAGFFFDWLANIILFFVPFVFVGVLSILRTFTNTLFIGEQRKMVKTISKAFRNPIINTIANLLVMGIPFITFALSILITQLPVSLKYIIIIGYGLFAPFYAYIEDELAACNIFEIATWVTWSEEYEEACRAFDRKFEEDPEAAREEVIAAVEKMTESMEKLQEAVIEELKDE